MDSSTSEVNHLNIDVESNTNATAAISSSSDLEASSSYASFTSYPELGSPQFLSDGGFKKPTASYQQHSYSARSETVPTISNYDYIVDGLVIIDADDNLRIDESFVTSDFTLAIIGVPVGEQAPILDGAKKYRGFELLFESDFAHNVVIQIDDLTAYQNFIAQTTTDATGGAISIMNEGTIVFSNIENPLLFDNNHADSTGGGAAGGAIYLSGGASIGDLYANFTNNTTSVVQQSSTTRYARGGAIAIGITDDYPLGYQPSGRTSSIGNIIGNFENNKASFGGALYVGVNASVGNVIGDFTNNIAEGYKQPTHTNGADGGGIRTYGGVFGSIDGNFTGNVANALSGDAAGGAVSLNGTEVTDGITGNFDGNIAIVNTESGVARGGAYSLQNQTGDYEIVFTNVNFENNVAATSSDDLRNVEGGALYISNSEDIVFLADGQDIKISDNYVVNNTTWNATEGLKETADSQRVYSAIYAKDSTVTLQTAAGTNNTITIDDGIYGVSSTPDKRSELIVNAQGDQRYDVKLNDFIAFQELIITEGGVELGTALHSDGSTSQGRFVDGANVTVGENGILKAHGSSFDGVGEIILQGNNEGATAGTLEVTGGRLATNIGSSAAVRQGNIDFIDNDSTLAAGHELYAETVNIQSTLYIEAATETGLGELDATHVDVETIFFHGYDKNDINNGGNQIVMDPTSTLDFHDLKLEIGTAEEGDIFELVVSSDPNGWIDVSLEDFTTSVLTLAGETLVQDEDYVILYRTDGGVNIELLVDVPPPPIPEPSTATLSLIALAALLKRRRRREPK